MPATPWSLFSPFTQTIGRFVNNPVTDWQRFYSPQVIFNYNPEDEPVEAHVLSKVGSYGSQLSTLIDVIDVLVTKMGAKSLTDEQKEAVKAFTDLRARPTRRWTKPAAWPLRMPSSMRWRPWRNGIPISCRN